MTELLQEIPFLRVVIFTLAFIVITLVFGGLYSAVRKKACQNIQRTFGSTVFLLFSFIGTPIHELSHCLACILFRHKMTKVVLFSPKQWKATGTLGEVQHTWHARNLYQRAGNFLIGTAPLFCGAGVSFLILRALGVKMTFAPERPLLFLEDLAFRFRSIWNAENLRRPVFWILLFVLVNIFLHVSLSASDLRGAAAGIVFFVLLVPLFCAALSLFGISLSRSAAVILRIDTSLFFVLSFGLMLDLIILIVSQILRFLLGR